MRSLRDGFLGTGFVIALVACGVWYARDPGLKHWSIPFGGRSAAPAKAQSDVTITRLDWSADGRTLLVLSRGEVGLDGPLFLHRTVAEGGRFPIDFDNELPAAAALHPDGRHVVVGSFRGQLVWFDLEHDQAKRLVELPTSTGFTEVAIAPDGKSLAAAAVGGRVYVCDPRGDAPALELDGSAGNVCDLRFSRDGLRLVTAATDGAIAVWDVPGSRLEAKFAAHDGPTTAAAFLDDGRVVSAGRDDAVRIWDLAKAREEWTGQFECGGINTLALSDDGKTAAWAGFNGRIVVWDLDRQRRRFEIATSISPMVNLRFSPDGSQLAAAGKETKIRKYDPRTGRELPAIELR